MTKRGLVPDNGHPIADPAATPAMKESRNSRRRIVMAVTISCLSWKEFAPDSVFAAACL